ncbi:hypothetical protein F5Y13DRAFT_161302 [Hypoxylon sp. FL1857]|nr:hypothetical protein F5Y13DRAFT_161302 [Hypoxylon sp. FL1857]
MHAIEQGYSLLTPGQHLLSPNSTGHSNSGKYPLHRCHSHSCKSAPTEQHRKENSREYEDGHWLFSPQPHSFHLRLATSGAYSPCQTRGFPESCRDRPLTPVSPNPVDSQSLKRRQERNTEDDLICVWLSGVYRSDCPNPEAEFAAQSTSVVPLDSGERVKVVAGFTCPTIVLQPPRRNRSTAQSGTGLDGPQSSDSDKLSKIVRDGLLSDLKESSRSADPSVTSQKLKSTTSGSIDWGKTWEKRKPRRKHDVSEASNLNHAVYRHGDDLFPAANDNNGNDSDSSSGPDSDDVSDDKSCSHLSEHDAQFHVIQKHAVSSCPELQRQLDDFGKSLSRPKTGNDQEQIARLRFQLDGNQHRHRFSVRNIVTKQFQSLGRRLKRSGSSTFSVRSELPAPRTSKERRRLARDSADIWPSSGEETPMFNTPESNITNSGPLPAAGHHFDPLAMASMMIATAELDRLSSRASLEQTSRTSGSSTGFSGSSPVSHTPLYTNPTSPNNETSESTVLYMPPTIPFNTPSSSGPQSSIVSPVSRPSQRRGQRRRGQRSRLSEVTTPDDIAPPGELDEECNEGRPSLSSSQIETLPECSATLNDGNEYNLYPEPLAINRNNGEGTGMPDNGPSDDIREPSLASEPTKPDPLHIIPRDKLGSLSQPPSGRLDSKREETILAPSRTSSIGKTPKSMYGSKDTSVDGQELSIMTTCAPGNGSMAAVNKSTEEASPESCHPNTWSESQGEPGDSDPFCPPGCLETRHSSQDSQDTSETVVRMLSVGETARPNRYSDSEVVGRCGDRMAKGDQKDSKSEPA